MPSHFQQFHLNVEFFLALVNQTRDDSPQYLRSHDSQTTLRYNIRQCLRNIQEQLNHESFDLQALDESSSDRSGPCPDLSTGKGGTTGSASETNDMKQDALAYHQIVDDLLALLMTDFDPVAALPNSPSHDISVKNSVVLLLATAPTLSLSALCTVLNRLLRRMDQETKTTGRATSQQDVQQLLDIFTSHATGYPQLLQLQLTENDLFVGLHVALSYYEQTCVIATPQGESIMTCPPPQTLALFIQCLIGYTSFVCLGTGNQEQITLDHWLQLRFMEQHGPSSSQDHLRRATDAYIAKIEQFGIVMIEFTLQLMEQAADPSSHIEQGNGTSHPAAIQDGNISLSQMTIPLGQGEIDLIAILQYATLATSFLVAMKHMHFNPISGGTAWAFEAMGRDLWREFSDLVVKFYTHSQATPDTNDEAFATRKTADYEAHAHLNRSAAATDTLWNLAKLHYPGGTSKSTFGQRNDAPLLVTSILCLWKNAEYIWDDSVETWIHRLLHFSFPLDTAGGKELRQPLQALILSTLYFPSPDGPPGLSAKRNAISSLHKLVLVADDRTALLSSSEEAGPWENWIVNQLPIDEGGKLLQLT